MKKIILSVIILFSFALQAQTILIADTMRNSETNTAIIQLANPPDSVVVSIYVQGTVSLDSLDVKLGFNKDVKFGLQNVNIYSLGATNTTYSKTLTITNSSASGTYTPVVVSIPKSALRGYNFIQLALRGHSSGNTTTSPQKAVLIYTIY